jgi:1-aminocyclopropane-1-carboxylate deaminase/D-cysteine desulfhydrase-like pyridoxal-dependent ACC family enzyme
MSPFTSECLSSTLRVLPRIELGQWPTPLVRLDGLSRDLGLELWVKRDDISALGYGGNKVRKLEFVLGEAQALGARHLLTIGGIGSNHVVATGYYGARLGMETHAVVVPQPMTEHVERNISLGRDLGIDLIPCSNRLAVPWVVARVKRSLNDVYLIPPGGSSPVGTVGFVVAALELRQQLEAGLMPRPRAIYVALGSGGTAAGLALGMAVAQLEIEVFAVRVVERWLINKTVTRLLALRTARLLRRCGDQVPARPFPLHVVGGYLGASYGSPTPAAEAAVRLATRQEGLRLETTYTGKTLAALIDRCVSGEQEGPLLWWNTFNSRDLDRLASSAASRTKRAG